MSNKQSVVEWLISILAHNDILDHKTLSSDERLYNLYKRLVEQAKEMENKQESITNDAIVKRAKEYSESYLNSGVAMSSFIQGCNWYREQLKSK